MKRDPFHPDDIIACCVLILLACGFLVLVIWLSAFGMMKTKPTFRNAPVELR